VVLGVLHGLQCSGGGGDADERASGWFLGAVMALILGAIFETLRRKVKETQTHKNAGSHDSNASPQDGCVFRAAVLLLFLLLWCTRPPPRFKK
jgi:hypothetical protein